MADITPTIKEVIVNRYSTNSVRFTGNVPSPADNNNVRIVEVK